MAQGGGRPLIGAGREAGGVIERELGLGEWIQLGIAVLLLYVWLLSAMLGRRFRR